MRSQVNLALGTGERRNEANDAIAMERTGGNIKDLAVTKMGG
ncbi:MAG: hypothetical protein ACK5XR_08915 [Pseudanabaena sp.]|jgi:hypothetical protein